MSRQRRSRRSSRPCVRRRIDTAKPADDGADLLALLTWLVGDGRGLAALRRHGNTCWLPINLVWMALLWAWAENRHLTDAFVVAAEQYRAMLPAAMVTTYQGLMGALVRWTPALAPLVCALVQQRMEQVGGRFYRVGGWVPIAFDGSRSSAARTVANEAAFAAPHHGTGKTARYRKKKTKGMRRTKNEKAPPARPQPQVWITLLWHSGLRLPWCWRLGPSHASERDHVIEMIGSGRFPGRTLFCGDAGFIGYRLWSTIVRSGHHFLVRVGGNVTLLEDDPHGTIERRGEGRVIGWPKAAQASGEPPLHLRLVSVNGGPGKARVWLLTSVTDERQLTALQLSEIYRKRWGIEVEFRGLKQTLDRAKLRCRNDRRLLAELDWSLLALAVAELFALRAQFCPSRNATSPKKTNDRCRPDPSRRSLAQTMRALRACLRRLNHAACTPSKITDLLRAALIDDYVRKKPKRARYRPPNPDKKPIGNPVLQPIGPEVRKLLRQQARKTTT